MVAAGGGRSGAQGVRRGGLSEGSANHAEIGERGVPQFLGLARVRTGAGFGAMHQLLGHAFAMFCGSGDGQESDQ